MSSAGQKEVKGILEEDLEVARERCRERERKSGRVGEMEGW